MIEQHTIEKQTFKHFYTYVRLYDILFLYVCVSCWACVSSVEGARAATKRENSTNPPAGGVALKGTQVPRFRDPRKGYFFRVPIFGVLGFAPF